MYCLHDFLKENEWIQPIVWLQRQFFPLQCKTESGVRGLFLNISFDFSQFFDYFFLEKNVLQTTLQVNYLGHSGKYSM